VPVLFLPAANRQHMVEAKAGILLPEPQHRLQIVGRKSEVDNVLCELHLPCPPLKSGAKPKAGGGFFALILALGTEFSGIGGNASIWIYRARASVPF
jgi:hypothetical protein